jgi:hypothetical protein
VITPDATLLTARRVVSDKAMESLSQGTRSNRPERRASPGYLLVSLALCSTTTTVLCAIEPTLRHWFVLPVTCAGTIVGIDALPWLRGKRDLFDPVGILSVLGIHFFFLAPLLHVYWDYWMPLVAPPADWRPWLAWMAVLNVIGLLVYRTVLGRRERADRSDRATIWQVERLRFMLVGTALFLFTAALQVWIYVNSGGISGYMNTVAADGMEAFAGMGWLFVISESGPIIAMMVYAVASDRHQILRRPVMIAGALALFFVMSIFFGGLRGSRSNTIWAVFWAAGIVHYRIRGFSRRAATAGVAGLLLFMYFYGFYKDLGFEGIARAVDGSESRYELETKTGRTTDALLLGDLARSDVQAFELYRLLDGPDEYAYGWGRTYVGDLAVLIPESIWPSRPLTKIVEGTNLLFGRESFRRSTFAASRVYGIAGELMLNFGPLAVPFAFALLGLCVRATDRALRSWAPLDARWLLAPVLVNLCFAVLIGDGDNLVFFSIKSLLIPSFLLIVSTKRIDVARRGRHPTMYLHRGQAIATGTIGRSSSAEYVS